MSPYVFLLQIQVLNDGINWNLFKWFSALIILDKWNIFIEIVLIPYQFRPPCVGWIHGTVSEGRHSDHTL